MPKIDDVGSEVALGDDLMIMPRLEFPIDVGIDLRPDDSAAQRRWQIVDRKQRDVLANVRVQDDSDGKQRAMFRWTDLAKRTTVANQLRHGSVRNATGRRVFLRPKIVSSPYAISLDEPDARPSWDLLAPLPSRVTRISVDFDLPEAKSERDGIEMGWIEPVDATSPRRTRGLAVFTPTDSETLSVGIRFDLRCTRKLSARVRVFGRLDSTMPWQLISRDVLENAADQVTARAAWLSQMSTQMATVYDRAGTDERRALRPSDATRSSGSLERIVEISKRLAELDSFCRRIEADVRARIRVWVQWPDAEQDLLVMGLPVQLGTVRFSANVYLREMRLSRIIHRPFWS